MDSQAGLRERKKQRTFETISNTAIALFLQRGFDQVSVADVAAASEVSKPTLFRYFPAKEDLVLYRFADHEDEASRVVAGRAPDESPLAALHRHFLAGLEARDPVTGLNGAAEVLAFHGLLYGTPSLVARLTGYTARSEDALAGTLAGLAADELTARLAASHIIATQRILALANWRKVSDGRTPDEVYGEAVAAADHAFGLLRTGFADAL